jgi:hypothetical protein
VAPVATNVIAATTPIPIANLSHLIMTNLLTACGAFTTDASAQRFIPASHSSIRVTSLAGRNPCGVDPLDPPPHRLSP